uniref:Uncharacterized protein n=1 Tax=Anopheles melas TaxID=34690 RepID=A0A182TTU8_9DIPT
MQDWSLDGSDSQSYPMQLHHPNNHQHHLLHIPHHHHHHHHHNHHRHQPHHRTSILSQEQQQHQQQQHMGGIISLNSSYTQEDVDEQDDDLEYTKHDLISLDNGVITDYERAQVESFFSGLGTEVSLRASINQLECGRSVYDDVSTVGRSRGNICSKCAYT